MLCSNCNGKINDVKIKVRQHIGCPACCGGIMIEQIAGQKCQKCGIFVSSTKSLWDLNLEI